MSSDDKRDGQNPSGQEAIEQIGERLKDLLGGVMGALQGKGGSGESESVIETEKGPIKTQMGWSVKLGGLELNGENIDALREQAPYRRGQHPGASRAQRSGPAPRRPAKQTEPAAAPEPRAAHVEVFDEEDAVIVTAELPGVAAEDVALDLQGARLDIAAAGARPFAASAELPEGVDPKAEPEMRMANGVLEIRIPKTVS